MLATIKILDFVYQETLRHAVDIPSVQVAFVHRVELVKDHFFVFFAVIR